MSSRVENYLFRPAEMPSDFTGFTEVPEHETQSPNRLRRSLAIVGLAGILAAGTFASVWVAEQISAEQGGTLDQIDTDRDTCMADIEPTLPREEALSRQAECNDIGIPTTEG